MNMYEIAKELRARLNKVDKTIGLSIGDWEDKRTWKLSFHGKTTMEQMRAAQKVIDDFEGRFDVREQ